MVFWNDGFTFWSSSKSRVRNLCSFYLVRLGAFFSFTLSNFDSLFELRIVLLVLTEVIFSPPALIQLQQFGWSRLDSAVPWGKLDIKKTILKHFTQSRAPRKTKIKLKEYISLVTISLRKIDTPSIVRG